MGLGANVMYTVAQSRDNAFCDFVRGYMLTPPGSYMYATFTIRVNVDKGCSPFSQTLVSKTNF